MLAAPRAPAAASAAWRARQASTWSVRTSVEWQPALDITRLGLAGIALAALITVTLGWALGRKR